MVASAAARILAARSAPAAAARSAAGFAMAGPSRLAAMAASRGLATDAAPASTASSSAGPPPGAAAASAPKEATSSPKLTGLVDAIEKLTLLEAAELVTALKTRLNITEVAMPAASAAPAAAAAAPAAAAAEAEEEKPKEKTVFTLKLKGLKDATAKAKVIREVKAINSSMNLVEAKKFVESAPQTLKEGVNKEEAEKIKKAIEEAGGIIELE